MGNSLQMVFQHYRELVRPADAEAFFAILPPPGAVARATVARARRPRVMPSREIKITAEVMAAVFDGGRLTLSRKDAVTALRSRVGCSVAAANNALAPEGRFNAHLEGTGGNLKWRQETTAAAA